MICYLDVAMVSVIYVENRVQQGLMFTTDENLVQCHYHHVKTNSHVDSSLFHESARWMCSA